MSWPGFLIGLLVAVGAIAVAWLVQGRWERLLVARTFTTALTVDQVAGVFASTVATFGWRLVDDEQGARARSHPLTGARQEIALSARLLPDGRTLATVRPARVARSRGVPHKILAVHLRMARLERHVRSVDRSVVVERHRPADRGW